MTDGTDPKLDPKLAGVRVTAAKCVRCGKPVQARYRPFCGQRCADIDLGSWFKGDYRVATDEAPETGSDTGADSGKDPEKA
jgi:endogenous inhibitor of DNA gyrase (YacG/DUF329 family)